METLKGTYKDRKYLFIYITNKTLFRSLYHVNFQIMFTDFNAFTKTVNNIYIL